MGITVYSLFCVMQDLYHQPYYGLEGFGVIKGNRAKLWGLELWVQGSML